MNVSNREVYLDNICGLLILHMVFTCHVAYYIKYDPALISYISTTLSFFMPWFFFKGGMVFKSKPLWICIKTGIRRLAIPFCVFNAIGIIWDLYLAHAAGEELHWNYLSWELSLIRDYQSSPSSLACWYLFTLFFVRIVFQLLHKKIHPLFMIMGGGIIAYILYKNGNTPITWGVFSFAPPFYLGNIFSSLSYYALGYWMKELQFNKWILAGALVLFVLKYFLPSPIDIRKNMLFGGYYILALLYGASGCVVFNNLFKRFLDKRLKLFTYIGKNSMVYYLVHYTPIMIFCYYSRNGYWGDMSKSSQFFLMSVILLFVFFLADIVHKFPKLKFIYGE